MSATDPAVTFDPPRRRPRARLAAVPQPQAPEPRRFSWEAAGVVLALVMQFVALIAFGATLDRRVATMEQVTAPLMDGQLARIDERTLQMQTQLAEISQRIDGGGR